MKKILFIIAFIGVTNFLNAQDEQWYVVNDGIQHTNGHQNPITNGNLYLHNVKHLEGGLPKRHEIFAIFSDGSFYNSYRPSNTTFAHTKPDDDLYGYLLNSSLPIKYLYWTNVYEGDDPPEVDVSNSSTTIYGQLTNKYYPIPLPITSDELSVSHDIVKNKDLTVAIHVEDPYCYDYRLIFNDCGPDCYDLLSQETQVFSGCSVCPTNTVVTFSNNTGEAQLNFNNEGNSFINFKVKSNVKNLVDSLARFTLQRRANGNAECSQASDVWRNIKSISVPIRNSHDPNYMLTEGLCKENKSNYHFLDFHIQVQNTSMDESSKIKIFAQFPPIIDFKHVYIKEYGIGQNSPVAGIAGNGLSANYIGNNTIAFIFPPEDEIYWDNNIEQNSIAYVKVCAKVKDQYLPDLFSGDLNALGTHGTTDFDGDIYQIETFVENSKLGNYDPNDNCICNRKQKVMCPFLFPWCFKIDKELHEMEDVNISKY